jgi:hypothetical protein
MFGNSSEAGHQQAEGVSDTWLSGAFDITLGSRSWSGSRMPCVATRSSGHDCVAPASVLAFGKLHRLNASD